MCAVVGYAGAPVKLLRGGVPSHGIGLAESRRFTVAVPGRMPLRNIHFSLVDVPDLLVLPPEYPTMQDIWMGAGPVPEILHRVLNLLAKARALLGLPSFEPLSRLFFTVLNLMKFGEHRGGMFVRARGMRDGVAVERSWHLLAEGNDGPYIPSMAVEAIVRKLVGGVRPAAGARPATDALELADYDALFKDRQIYTGFREDQAGAPVYQQMLGTAFAALPLRWSGLADVTRGTGLLARLIARVIGFPKAASQTPVSLSLTPEDGGERWTRDFGGTTFSSLQTRGTGRNEHLVVERFGPTSIALALIVEDGRLSLVPRRWSCLGIPMPQFLLPGGHGFESEIDGQFHFDVAIAAPLIGLIVAYKGGLKPE
jgi:hypothetical protein